MSMTTGRLERSINRSKEQLRTLEEKKDRLSNHGYWEIGFLKGRISVLEDWLDELKEQGPNSLNSEEPKDNNIDKISLKGFLEYFDFTYEIFRDDVPGEKEHRLKLIEEMALDEDELNIPMLGLVDLQRANLGGIEGDRFSLDANLIYLLIERLDVYINDYLLTDFKEELESHGVDKAYQMSLENMVDKAKELGIESVNYELANYILRPELIDMSDVFNNKANIPLDRKIESAKNCSPCKEGIPSENLDKGRI